jgi:hypothetical protein
MTESDFREVLENLGEQPKRISFMANVTALWRKIFNKKENKKDEKVSDSVDDSIDSAIMRCNRSGPNK